MQKLLGNNFFKEKKIFLKILYSKFCTTNLAIFEANSTFHNTVYYFFAREAAQKHSMCNYSNFFIILHSLREIIL
jgi:hypothetical protein